MIFLNADAARNFSTLLTTAVPPLFALFVGVTISLPNASKRIKKIVPPRARTARAPIGPLITTALKHLRKKSSIKKVAASVKPLRTSPPTLNPAQPPNAAPSARQSYAKVAYYCSLYY